jgi:hypothetical protein
MGLFQGSGLPCQTLTAAGRLPKNGELLGEQVDAFLREARAA